MLLRMAVAGLEGLAILPPPAQRESAADFVARCLPSLGIAQALKLAIRTVSISDVVSSILMQTDLATCFLDIRHKMADTMRQYFVMYEPWSQLAQHSRVS